MRIYWSPHYLLYWVRHRSAIYCLPAAAVPHTTVLCFHLHCKIRALSIMKTSNLVAAVCIAVMLAAAPAIVVANDPAGSWLAYTSTSHCAHAPTFALTFSCTVASNPGAGKILSMNATTVVPSNPAQNGASPAFWPYVAAMFGRAPKSLTHALLYCMQWHRTVPSHEHSAAYREVGRVPMADLVRME